MHQMKVYVECEDKCLRPSNKMFGYVRIEPDGTKRRAVNGAVTTYHRAVLASIRGALSKLDDSYELHIYCDDHYVMNCLVNGNLENWGKNSYLKKDGHLIKDYDMWREIYHLTRGQKVVPHIGNHEYSRALWARFEQKRKEMEDV